MEYIFKGARGPMGYSLVATTPDKKVIIRKGANGAPYVVEFDKDHRISEIMHSTYYKLRGEVVTEYPKPVSLKQAAEDYNLESTWS